MRDHDIVYLTDTYEYGACQGNTTETMELLLGNQVMTVDDVMIGDMDFESIQEAWESNIEYAEAGDEGYTLREVTDAEADALYATRYEFDDQDEVDAAAVEAAGRDAYDDGQWVTDNPYNEETQEEDYNYWLSGWEDRYMEMRGMPYDPEDEHEQEAADDAASTETLLRWFHEEQHAG